MNDPRRITRTGLEALLLNLDEKNHPLVKRLVAVLHVELTEMRQANDAPEPIQETTLRRGEIRLAKRILARLEVGPESRQSEPAWPESASVDEFVGNLNGD